ncbi:hypothetical protein A0H81_07800 [Grifola frondosa]|uniref:Coiled-coil domain-containing protein 174 n=1 Tax=Grifola frondosa TaxID=5627 RepID=A0A1C7MAU9_GRIFR|nr:hypothetical protein A0H81_07800 [Grifola frondosa]
MAPKNKAKAAGVSSSSFFDLKAELAKQEEELSKNRAAGKATTIVGAIKRPDKKPTVWARQNAGVINRAAHDIELEEISKPTLDSARAILERKAKVYEKLRKGKAGGLSDKQYDALLVDFDQKLMESYESDSDDLDESSTVPQAPVNEVDDPIVEYEDEFGRIRTARKSEVPRHLAPQATEEPEEDFDPFVIYNPVNHFPVYEPSAERVAAIEAEFAEENNPLNIHYDASREVRAKGAAFYQFSGDEETRKQQMEEIRQAREETRQTRETFGAADLRPGEPRDGKEEEELEERRKMLHAKRRKVSGKEPIVPADGPAHPPATAAPMAPVPSGLTPNDPFAALKNETANRKGKEKEKPSTPLGAADAFLAQLEQDMLKGAR